MKVNKFAKNLLIYMLDDAQEEISGWIMGFWSLRTLAGASTIILLMCPMSFIF